MYIYIYCIWSWSSEVDRIWTFQCKSPLKWEHLNELFYLLQDNYVYIYIHYKYPGQEVFGAAVPSWKVFEYIGKYAIICWNIKLYFTSWYESKSSNVLETIIINYSPFPSHHNVYGWDSIDHQKWGGWWHCFHHITPIIGWFSYIPSGKRLHNELERSTI